MQTAIRHSTRVLPGNRIEIFDPQLRVGDEIEVTLMLPETREEKQSVIGIIEDLKGRRLFKSAIDVDRYLHEERNSWDR